MKIGIFGGDFAGKTADDVIAAARTVHEEGFATFWAPQVFGFDALTLLAVVAREVPEIELGTAVVPTYPRHPMVLAAQAMTTQAISGGRLLLGIGLSHQLVVEGMWGLSFEKPVRHMREYLTVLTALIREGNVSFTGETMSASCPVAVEGSTPMPILVAALGPKMLELAGTVADGTVTWMTGPKGIGEHIVPSITAAAERASRPAPRIVVALPVCVTDDPDAARDRANKIFQMYGSLPSYRAMLDRSGAEGPGDVVIVGDESSVRDQIAALADLGTSDLIAAEFAPYKSPDRERTRELLRSL
ncbi:MAG: LLM class F420-dependent oxidoreductase [Actinobacteria bacterium]|nr:LLM class F420-dependent oxidoreductase [Actinomycetota bacterium]